MKTARTRTTSAKASQFATDPIPAKTTTAPTMTTAAPTATTATLIDLHCYQRRHHLRCIPGCSTPSRQVHHLNHLRIFSFICHHEHLHSQHCEDRILIVTVSQLPSNSYNQKSLSKPLAQLSNLAILSAHVLHGICSDSQPRISHHVKPLCNILTTTTLKFTSNGHTPKTFSIPTRQATRTLSPLGQYHLR